MQRLRSYARRHFLLMVCMNDASMKTDDGQVSSALVQSRYGLLDANFLNANAEKLGLRC